MTEPLFEFLSPRDAERPYTVSEINDGISLILESHNTLVWVEGEISNWRVSSNGHCYCKLKDSGSQIPAVLWRSAAAVLQFTPEDGLAVLVIATIRVYQKAGYYQLDIHRMEPRGKGALYLAFEQLTKRLEKEGLFDPEHKKPLPLSINRLGVVTSKQGAAIRDIVKVVASRAPHIDIVLVDVPVQGEAAALQIAAGLAALNEWAKIDTIIVGRGGGSAEDLWPFNEEVVARAIYASKIPVISAVGHEIDFTIADFVADARAPTPSAAAELASPDRRENRKYFDQCATRFSASATDFFAQTLERFDNVLLSSSLRRAAQLIIDGQQELDDETIDFFRGFKNRAKSASDRLSIAFSRLNAISPLAVLSRGYSVVTKIDGSVVRSGGWLEPGETVTMRFQEGSAAATVTSVVP
ncbi:MAG: exodeoxyribonuclease VII large subunit [Chitinispirillaceae bacterium]|jgi:exodeoxyribonuclease VII large subunit